MSRSYLEYTIWLPDSARVAVLQAHAQQVWIPNNGALSPTGPGPGSLVTNPLDFTQTRGSVVMCPYRAARYDWLGLGGSPAPLPILGRGVAVTSPSITSQWIRDPGQTTNPINKDTFDQDAGGFWGLFGATDTFDWLGRFLFWPAPIVVQLPTDPAPGASVAAIRTRRWVEGFEHPEAGEGGSGSHLSFVTRAASRHADGFGLGIRPFSGGISCLHAVQENGGGTSKDSWERFYIRPRTYPSGKVAFWRTSGSISGLAGIQLAFESTGKLSVNDTTGFDVVTKVGESSVVPLDGWSRVDVIFEYGSGAYFELWLNGVLAVNIEGFDNTGLGGGTLTMGVYVQNHVSSNMGQQVGFETRGLCLDVDDWMNAAVPSRTIAQRTGLDWRNGSKMKAVRVTGPAASMGAWAGDWRTLLQEPAPDATVALTSSTSGDVLQVTTDAEMAIDQEPGSLGAVALIVGIFSFRASTGNGQIGFAIAGASPTYTTMVDSLTVRWNRAAYFPAGALAPTVMTPLELSHTKTATASASSVFALAAVAELIGIFGPEDVLPGVTPPAVIGNTGIHDAPYPRSVWAKASQTPPVAPVAIIAGTYTGNDTAQDLLFEFPVTFLMIRHVASGNDGTSWWSSMLSSHHGFRNENESNGAVQICVDPDFVPASGGSSDQLEQYVVRIVGNAANVNASGETYAYTAFCDPGMRFTVNGAITTPRGTADRITNLWRSIFKPEAAFLHQETALGSTNVAMFYKGRGHATQNISKLDAAETASAIVLARGQITTRSALHFTSTGNAIAFAAWRRDDGSGDPGIPQTVQIFSYTGDGTGNRTIAFGTVSGVRPLWALVVPHDNPAVFRDHTHTGTSSTTVPTTPTAANGIRGGGIDQLLVGSQLNANGILYDVFIIPGGTTACNGGFSCPGTFIPVAPIPPPDWNNCEIITLSPTSLPSGAQGTAYNQTIAATGGTAPRTFAVVNGALPDGLSLSSGGVITGTPTGTTDASFTVRATDVNECFGEQGYTISLNGSGCPAIALSPGEIPLGVVGQPYQQTITGSGGAGPYAFTVTSGTLPAGLGLSANGSLSGTLTAAAVEPFTIRATDIHGCFGEQVYSLSPDEEGGGPACIAASLAISNRALSRIGVSQAIVDMSADLTPEAALARLHFATAVDTTLRDFPWPFATKYAALALVAGSTGSPVNTDWRYSYRQPVDCVFERRIVVARGPGVDPTPPPFQLGSDTSGNLIYTNQASAVLEYTCRPSCASLRGDALFRDALTWALAAALAPGLTRVETVADRALQNYRAAILNAAQVIRQGNPGLAPADPTVDTSNAAIAANLALVNRALMRVGAQTIANLNAEQSREATAARLLFEEELRSTLYDFPWPFATKYATLAVVTGPSPTANADWTYAYRQPADCVFERRLVVGRAGALDPTPPPFQLTADGTGGLILTNQAAAVLEYTARIEGAVLASDRLFRDAFAWRLAAALAPSLANPDPEKPEQLGRGPEDPTKPKEGPPSKRQTRVADSVNAWRMYQAVLLQARTIMRPGNPGPPAAAGTLDLTGGQVAANLAVVNRALVRIGAQTIANLATDQGREATAARLVFEAELLSVLRDHPWAFATAYVTPTLVDGAVDDATNFDWQYCYRVPTTPTVVFWRRIAREGVGRRVDLNPATFRIGKDATGGLLFTDEIDPVFEVTVRPDGCVAAADSLFQDAFAWRLAAALAPSLAMIEATRPEQLGRGPEDPRVPKDPTRALIAMRAQMAAAAEQRYQMALQTARTLDAREQQQGPPDADPDWISGRN